MTGFPWICNLCFALLLASGPVHWTTGVTGLAAHARKPSTGDNRLICVVRLSQQTGALGCRWRRRAHQATSRRGTPRPLHYSRGPRESVLVRRRRVVYRGGCRAGPRGARSGRSAGYFTTDNDGILLPRSTESTLYLAGLLRPTTKTTASDGTTGRRRLGRRLRAWPDDDNGLGTETLAEAGPTMRTLALGPGELSGRWRRTRSKHNTPVN